MKKTAVIGICGQSVFIKCDSLPSKGESIISNNIHIEPGGKGTNASCTIKRLGGSVSFLVCLSDDDYSKKCLDFFKKEDINTVCITKHGKTDYGVIMNDSKGNNHVTVCIDENVRLTADDLVLFKDEINSSDYLLLSGELTDQLLLKIVEQCDDRTKIIFDPSPVRSYPKEFLDRVWLFTPNETEFENIHKLTKPKNVVVTLSEKGAKLIENNKETVFDAYKINVVNTTGAGDVFNGALCYALELDYNLADAVKFAMKASAYKVAHNYVIDGIPTLEDLKTVK